MEDGKGEIWGQLSMFVVIGDAIGEVGHYLATPPFLATPPSLDDANGDGSADKFPKRPNRNRVKLKSYGRPGWNTGDVGAGYRRPGRNTRDWGAGYRRPLLYSTMDQYNNALPCEHLSVYAKRHSGVYIPLIGYIE